MKFNVMKFLSYIVTYFLEPNINVAITNSKLGLLADR